MIRSRSLARVLAAFTLLGTFAAEAQAAKPKDIALPDAMLSVSVKDSLDFTRHEMEYHVVKSGKKYRLHFPPGREPKGLYSGLRVNVKGKKLSSSAVSVGTESTSFQVIGGAELVGVGGVRQAVVLIIKSSSAVSGATPAQIASTLASADTWYQETSFQTLSLKNDRDANGVPDIYTVTISGSSASAPESSAFTFCNSAKANAKTQVGVDPALYNHVICILPPDMTYSWFGQAYINGTDVVINGNYAHSYAGGYTHEVGHNLGMHHANTPGTEYGESAAVMGGNAGTARRDFNGPHKTQMGWIPLSTVGAGSYELNAVEAQVAQRVSSHTVLKVRDTVAAQDLYVSYRAPLGTFGPGLNIPYRTSIHTWPGGASQTVLIATLGDGETFTQNGVSITQAAHTATSASVVVGTQCTAAAPSVTIDPSTYVTRTNGAASFTVLVRNNDVNCSTPVTYALAGTGAANWGVALGSSSITVAPQQSASTSVTVTPDVLAGTGNYSFTVGAAAAGHANGFGSAQFQIDSSAPNAVSSLNGSVDRKGKVSLSWSAPADVGSGIAGYTVYRNGTAVANPTSGAFSESPGAGTFSYSVLARDRAGNVSAAGNTITLTVSGSGPKGRR